MAERFIASPPSDQHPETYRQFLALQRYLQELQRELRSLVLDFIIPNFTFAAHGTMFNQTPVTGPNIGTGWQRIVSFDSVNAARRITFDPTADTWTYENPGIYQVSVEMVLSHGESNQGRQFEIRLQDGSNTSDGIPVSIGRNQPGSNISMSFLQEITEADLADTYSLEVGNGDSITGVIWEAASVTIINVGAWSDDVPGQGQ